MDIELQQPISGGKNRFFLYYNSTILPKIKKLFTKLKFTSNQQNITNKFKEKAIIVRRRNKTSVTYLEVAQFQAAK